MKKLLLMMVGITMLLVAGMARATYDTWEIVELYSNADGTVQFVLLHEYAGLNGKDLLAGHTLQAVHAGQVKTFTFPYNLPSTNTAGRYVLIATQGYVDLETSVAEFRQVPADYIIPNQFLPTDGGTVQYADVDTVNFNSLPTDGSSALYTPANVPNYTATNVARNFSGAATTLPSLAVTVIEYYNPTLYHYFITNLQPDIDALDSGRIPGWYRSGSSFYAFATGGAGYSPVCRYYIPPQHGNSHFFSASPAECQAIASRIGFDPNYSGYILETSTAFYVVLPNTQTGACPSGTAPVYRLWNGRADSNHRYTTDLNVRAQMIGAGYTPEGYGPLGVAMCVPV